MPRSWRSSQLTDDDIKESVLHQEEEEEEDEEDITPAQAGPSAQEMVQHMTAAIEWLQKEGEDPIHILNAKAMLSLAIRKSATAKQVDIRSMMKRKATTPQLPSAPSPRIAPSDDLCTHF